VYRHSNRLWQEARRRELERPRRRGTRAVLQYAVSTRGEHEEAPEFHEERIRFWSDPPHRVREEVESSGPGSRRTTVVDGELWWTYTPDWGATSNVDLSEEERAHHGVGRGERFGPLLDPSGLIAVLDFVAIAAANGGLRVRARPRDDLEPPLLHRLPFLSGTEELELDVDGGTGVVRRVTSFLDGQLLAETRLDELALDEPFPADTFVFVPPPGVELLPPESVARRSYTLEAAAEAAPFAVFFVRELPEGQWRLHVHYNEPRRRPPAPARLFLAYHRADGRGALTFAQQAAEGEGGFGWAGPGPPGLETVERAGVAYTVARADRERGGQNAVQWEREGTRLHLQSQELDLDTLLRLAAEAARLDAR
jgi:hypothetical protein